MNIGSYKSVYYYCYYSDTEIKSKHWKNVNSEGLIKIWFNLQFLPWNPETFQESGKGLIKIIVNWKFFNKIMFETNRIPLSTILHLFLCRLWHTEQLNKKKSLLHIFIDILVLAYEFFLVLYLVWFTTSNCTKLFNPDSSSQSLQQEEIYSWSIMVTTPDCGPGGPLFKSQVGANIIRGSNDCTGLTRVFIPPR